MPTDRGAGVSGLGPEGGGRRRAVDRRRGRQMGEIDRHVAGHEQVEPAVAVVVAERAARRPAVDRDPGLLGDVVELERSLGPVQPVLPEVGDVDVLGAVVVDVADADALSPPLVGDAGARGDVA